MDLSNDQLRALLAAASPGPWDVYLWHQADDIKIWDVMADTMTVAECQWCHDDAVKADVVRANARLIALAPALAAEVIRLRARADAAQAEIARLRAECFSLAAVACGGFYGGDQGHAQCTLVDAQRARADEAEAQNARLRAILDAVMDIEKVQPTGDPSDPLSWEPVSSYVVSGSVHDAALTRAKALEAALRACVEAHESGRYEIAQAAYHAARAALKDDA